MNREGFAFIDFEKGDLFSTINCITYDFTHDFSTWRSPYNIDLVSAIASSLAFFEGLFTEIGALNYISDSIKFNGNDPIHYYGRLCKELVTCYKLLNNPATAATVTLGSPIKTVDQAKDIVDIIMSHFQKWEKEFTEPCTYWKFERRSKLLELHKGGPVNFWHVDRDKP